MANKPLQSIKFPDLPDTYTIPVVDSTLAVSGAAADAKKTGDGLADKVDKVSGKGLSTNDYTNAEKSKLAGIETGATKTTIDSTLTVIGNAADAKAVGDAIANEDKKTLAAFATDTATGAIAHFEDGADSIPMKDVLVHIEPVQSGSGDPSPDNVRPISGWTGCEVQRTGKNLCMPSLYSISGENIIPNKSTVTIDEDEYVITPSGTNEDVFFGEMTFTFGNVPKTTGNTFVEEGETYTATVLDAESKFDKNFIQFMDKDNKLVRTQIGTQSIRFGKSVTFTVPQGVKYIGFRIGSELLSAGNTYKVKIQLETGSTATAYEPYSGDTYDITFPTSAGTVYGGYVDVTNGELVTCPYFASYNGETLTGEWISNRDKYVAGTTPTIGAQVVNIGAVGETYPLTPQEITSLLGTNNLWADTGDSDVEYRADTKLYVTKKITEVVSALS